ncbi:MAG: hypothetical protein QXW41_04630 [Fervidicoccaceae archaeon]
MYRAASTQASSLVYRKPPVDKQEDGPPGRDVEEHCDPSSYHYRLEHAFLNEEASEEYAHN